jgi:hypothetical protein
MEKILTTAALVAGGIFAMWILFADPGGEDGKGGEMNMAMIGALFMIPVFILLIIGIVLFLPILLGIALVIFLAYAVFQCIRWFLARERKEKSDRAQEGGVRMFVRSVAKRLKRSSCSVMDSPPVRTLRERTVSVTVRTRKAIVDTGKSLIERAKKETRGVREADSRSFREIMHKIRSSKPSDRKVIENIREVFRKSKERVVRVRDNARKRISDRIRLMRHTSDGAFADDREERYRDGSRRIKKGLHTQRNVEHPDVREHRSHSVSLRERLIVWKGAFHKKSEQRREKGQHAVTLDRTGQVSASRSAKRKKSSDRLQNHDPISNMRNIGWSTRKHLGEVYHHRQRSR